MDDSPYSNREIDFKIQVMLEKVTEVKQDLMIPILRIETQTTKTNGRVMSLEGWRTWILGGAAVFVPIFIVVSGWLILQTLNTPNVVEGAVSKVFQDYDQALKTNN